MNEAAAPVLLTELPPNTKPPLKRSPYKRHIRSTEALQRPSHKVLQSIPSPPPRVVEQSPKVRPFTSSRVRPFVVADEGSRRSRPLRRGSLPEDDPNARIVMHQQQGAMNARERRPITAQQRAWCTTKAPSVGGANSGQSMVQTARDILRDSALQTEPTTGMNSCGQQYFVPEEWIPRSGAEHSRVLKYAASLVELSKSQPQFVTSPDAPYFILAVNDSWLQTLGFRRHAVVGSTPKLIQGKETEKDSLAVLKSSLAARSPVTVHLTNFDSERRPFDNLLTVEPITSSGEQLFLATSQVTFRTPERVPSKRPTTRSRPPRTARQLRRPAGAPQESAQVALPRRPALDTSRPSSFVRKKATPPSRALAEEASLKEREKLLEKELSKQLDQMIVRGEQEMRGWSQILPTAQAKGRDMEDTCKAPDVAPEEDLTAWHAPFQPEIVLPSLSGTKSQPGDVPARRSVMCVGGLYLK